MILTTIDQEIKAAMLAKDNAALRGLRAIKAAFLVAKTEKDAVNLDEEGELKILQKLIKQRKESADIYKAQNRDDLYQVEVEEMEVISRFLPKQMSKEEVQFVVDEVIKNIGATNMKDMGKVMGLANKQLVGKADGKLISEIIKQRLA
ncbi:uncharacterized protein YqeY [Pedobacter sp. UYEF25]